MLRIIAHLTWALLLRRPVLLILCHILWCLGIGSFGPIRLSFEVIWEPRTASAVLLLLLPLVLAAGKGRAKSPHLLPPLRQLCALALVSGSGLLDGPSELNPADRTSRSGKNNLRRTFA